MGTGTPYISYHLLVLLLAIFNIQHGSTNNSDAVLLLGGLDKDWQFIQPEYYFLKKNESIVAGPVIERQGHGSALLNGQLAIMFGGRVTAYGPGAALPSVVVYNHKSRQVQELLPMRQARCYPAVAALNSTHIYVCGGLDSNWLPQPSCEVLIEGYQWRSIAPMRTVKEGLGLVALKGGIFSMGADLDSELYSPEEDTWSAKPPMLHARSWFFDGVIGESVYVCGGTWNGIFKASCERYDSVTEKWYELGPTPYKKYLMSTATLVIGEKLMFFGGTLDQGRVSSVVWSYGSITKQWQTERNLYSTRSSGEALLINSMESPSNHTLDMLYKNVLMSKIDKEMKETYKKASKDESSPVYELATNPESAPSHDRTEDIINCVSSTADCAISSIPVIGNIYGALSLGAQALFGKNPVKLLADFVRDPKETLVEAGKTFVETAEKVINTAKNAAKVVADTTKKVVKAVSKAVEETGKAIVKGANAVAKVGNSIIKGIGDFFGKRKRGITYVPPRNKRAQPQKTSVLSKLDSVADSVNNKVVGIDVVLTASECAAALAGKGSAEGCVKNGLQTLGDIGMGKLAEKLATKTGTLAKVGSNVQFACFAFALNDCAAIANGKTLIGMATDAIFRRRKRSTAGSGNFSAYNHTVSLSSNVTHEIDKVLNGITWSEAFNEHLVLGAKFFDMVMECLLFKHDSENPFDPMKIDLTNPTISECQNVNATVLKTAYDQQRLDQDETVKNGTAILTNYKQNMDELNKISKAIGYKNASDAFSSYIDSIAQETIDVDVNMTIMVGDVVKIDNMRLLFVQPILDENAKRKLAHVAEFVDNWPECMIEVTIRNASSEANQYTKPTFKIRQEGGLIQIIDSMTADTTYFLAYECTDTVVTPSTMQESSTEQLSTPATQESTSPGTGSGTTATEPEPVTMTKESTSSKPETVTTRKESTSTKPEAVTTTKESTSTEPETAMTTKESTSTEPEAVTTAKESTSTKPETMMTSQEPTSSEPEMVMTTKESTSIDQETVTTTKESTSTERESVATTKESTSTTPETVSTTKESTSTELETVMTTKESTTEPETVTLTKESTSTLPEMVPTTKESTSTEPETLMTTKESTSTEPETPMTTKESTSTEPEIPMTTKESMSTEPEFVTTTKASTSTEPETLMTTKESTSTEPETVTTTKESTSTEPETVTTTKESSSTEPETVTTTKESTSTEPETVTTKESTSTKPEFVTMTEPKRMTTRKKQRKPQKVPMIKTPRFCTIKLSNKAKISGNPKQNQLRHWYKRASMSSYFLHRPEKKFRRVTCPKGMSMRLDAFSLRPKQKNKQVRSSALFRSNKLDLICNCKHMEPYCSFKAIYKKRSGRRHQLVFHARGKASYRINTRKRFHVVHRINGVRCT